MGRIKDSPLLRWTQRKNSETATTKKKEKTRKWLHTEESLLSGDITYLVKFFGSTEVDQSRGLEVVKEGIKKLKLTQQLKKCEGTKTPKVLLAVSVDGVAIQDPKSKTVLHHHPLQRISYCADDKAEKKFFSFISSDPETSVHSCYVFASNKQAEEISLTIGQAFQLSYEKYQLELGKSTEPETEKVVRLESDNLVLRKRLMDLASMLDKNKLHTYMMNNNIQELGLVESDCSKDPSKGNCSALMEESMDSAVDTRSCMLMSFQPQPQLDTLNLEDLDDEDFDPRAGSDGHSSDALDFLNTPGFRNPRTNSMSTPIIENPRPCLITHLSNITPLEPSTPGEAGSVIGTPSYPHTPFFRTLDNYLQAQRFRDSALKYSTLDELDPVDMN